jgi:hypothetical protein
MNKNITSNTELIDIIKKENIKNFNGVYPKDKLSKPLKDGFYIINLQDSDKGSGTHWTAIYKINDGFSFYYDSFGFPAPENIEDILHKYEYNKKQIQDIDSTSCGFYCVAFIKFMYNKNDKLTAFNTFCNLFGTNTKDNEFILYQLLYRS